MKRRFVAVALVVLMAAVAVTGATLAFFSDSDNALNLFQFNNLDIQISEFPVATEVDENTGLTSYITRKQAPPTTDGAGDTAIVNPKNYSKYAVVGDDPNQTYTMVADDATGATYAYRLVSQWEQTDPKNADATAVFTEEYSRLYPGAVIPKDPWVDNIGDMPVLVRANVTVNSIKGWIMEAYLYSDPLDTDANKTTLANALGIEVAALDAMKMEAIVAAIDNHANSATLWEAFKNDSNLDLGTIFQGNVPEEWARNAAEDTFNLNGTNNDSVTYTYYYLAILPVEENTTPIFTGLIIPTWVEDKMEDYDFSISIEAQAIQADGLANNIVADGLTTAEVVDAFTNYTEN